VEEGAQTFLGLGAHFLGVEDVVVASEVLCFVQLDQVLVGRGLHLISSQHDDQLSRSSLFQLLNPSLCVLQGVFLCDVIQYDSGMGVSVVHSVKSHCLLISRDVPDAQTHFGTDSL